MDNCCWWNEEINELIFTYFQTNSIKVWYFITLDGIIILILLSVKNSGVRNKKLYFSSRIGLWGVSGNKLPINLKGGILCTNIEQTIMLKITFIRPCEEH